MGAVHFSIGEGAGWLLTSIAREKLTQEFNPVKAIEFLTKSLHGCSEEFAAEIVCGKYFLQEDMVEQTINAVRYNIAKHENNFRFDIEEWAERKLLEIKEDCRDWIKVLNRLQRDIILKGSYLFEFDSVDVRIKYSDLFRHSYEGDFSEIIDNIKEELENQNAYNAIKTTIQGVKYFIERSFKIQHIMKWAASRVKDFPKGFAIMVPELRMLYTELNNLLFDDKGIAEKIRIREHEDRQLSQYLSAERDISNQRKNKIRPVDITLGFSAGWLAPNGDFYGLNGTKANMLHNQIADALLDNRIIPHTIKNDLRANPDRWLEENGWAKVHDDWILFAGYDYTPAVPMTRDQQQKIYEYGKACCKGILRLGYNNEPVNVVRFRSIETTNLYKYFKL